MRTRQDVLVASDDMGTSGTLIYNLDYSDPLTQIILTINATNGASGNINNPIERNVSKIEIVDGSEVLWSLPGDVAYALFHGQVGGKNNERYSGAISDSQRVNVPIRFGRYRYDPELSFNPAGFRNPQLKVTFDEATVRAAGATGFVSDSFTLTLTADLMEQAPAPVGFLSAEEIYTYTSLASGDTVIDMPTELPYRQLLVRAYESQIYLGTSLTNFKLNADGGKFIPFDVSAAQLVALAAIHSPLCEKMIYAYVANAAAIEGWLGIGDVYGAYHHQWAYIMGASSYSNGFFTVRSFTDAGVAAGVSSVHYSIRGQFPHNTVPYFFGRPDELAEYFPAPDFRNLKLYLTNGNAGAEVNVAVEQFRRY